MNKKIKKLAVGENHLTFNQLISSIQEADHYFASQASKAVNVSLTLRNWVIGCYISEFELNGEDRAIYGEKLLSELAKQLEQYKISNCRKRQLYDYIKFYRVYPQIVRTVSALFNLSPDELIARLSYSMFKLLVEIENPISRAFYEIESIRGNWSVRDLKRQIASLYFERTGLSKNKNNLAALTQKNIQGIETNLNIRDPYVFEFLGIKSKEVMAESVLEEALLNKLQDFLLELGHGFCFESSQKRILIGGKHYFIDLVFYHRILKCHVLVEFKVDEFNHEHLGQLNTYISWFQKNMMAKGDNSPIGILLCTKKDYALAEYALAGMSNKFVSKYQVELPKKKEIEEFLGAVLKDAK